MSLLFQRLKQSLSSQFSQLSPPQSSRQHGLFLQHPSQGSPTICSWIQGLPQKAEHHDNSSYEEARPQVAESVLNRQGHIPEQVQAQTTTVFLPNPPHLLSHSTATLQCTCHCQASAP